MKISNRNSRVYKENYLLKSGIIIFLCSLLLSIILSHYNESESSSRVTRFNDFRLIHFLAAFTIAPVVEEIIFRGIFTGKRFFKYVMYFGSLIYIVLLQNYYLIPLVIVLIVLHELNKDKQTPGYIYCLNAVLFGFMHYGWNDLNMSDTWFGALMTTGIGLILIWMVSNFGLIYSILLHALNNFIAIALIILGNETSDMTLKKVETKDFIMKYQRVSFFNVNESMQNFGNKSLKGENVSISTAQSSLCFDEKLDDLYFGKFNISIERKSSSTKQLDCASFHQLLDKTDLKQSK